MNEKIQHYKDNSIQFWQKLSKQHKAMVVATILFLLVALIAFIYITSKSDYEVVYTNLAPKDAAGIKAYLDQNSIPYQLLAGGSAISVPKDNAAGVKVDLASNGLPQSGSIGYELFRDNMSGWGMTDSEFGVLERDAISGELEKLIQNINGISDAQVMITLPEESLFVSNSGANSSTASVILTVDPLAQLDSKQVRTLYLLVSKSVPKLPLENITISDQYGQLLALSEPGTLDNTSSPTVERQFQIRKNFELDIQNNLQGMLGTLIGKDKVIVSVVANLNFDQRRETYQLVEPVLEQRQSGIPIAVQQITESFSGTGGVPGSVVGTGNTDVPQYPGANGDGQSEYERNEESINYEINRITKDIQASPYVVRDITINVGVEPPDPDDPSSLTEEDKSAIRTILSNVVRASLAGSDQDISDEDLLKRISVFPRTFDKRTSVQASANSQWWYYGLGALGMLAVGGVGYALARRRRPDSTEEEVIPAKLEELDMEGETTEVQMRKQLEQLARRKPDEFTRLLRTWIAED